MRGLKEHVHYEVNVKLADEVHSSASVQCKLCGKSYSLSQGKSSKPMISNWTRHVVTCLDSKCASKGNTTRRLEAYLSTSSSADASSGSTFQPSTVSLELRSGKSAISIDSEPDDDLVARREVASTPTLSSFQLASYGQQQTETAPEWIAEGRIDALPNTNNQHFRLSPPN